MHMSKFQESHSLVGAKYQSAVIKATLLSGTPVTWVDDFCCVIPERDVTESFSKGWFLRNDK